MQMKLENNLKQFLSVLSKWILAYLLLKVLVQTGLFQAGNPYNKDQTLASNGLKKFCILDAIDV